jgi:Ca2+-binding RTX toxin-like protein
MVGGAGNDYYIVDSLSDVVVDSAGTDTIKSNVMQYTLAANVEILELGTGNIAYGNASANTLLGSSGDNFLYGAAGSDSLSGGSGNDLMQGALSSSTGGRGEIDTLTGGVGADIFVLGYSSGALYNDGVAGSAGTSDFALITDFAAGTDSLKLYGSAAKYSLANVTVGSVTGAGLYYETGATDELIAIIQVSGAAATTSNTITTAIFV